MLLLLHAILVLLCQHGQRRVKLAFHFYGLRMGSELIGSTHANLILKSPVYATANIQLFHSSTTRRVQKKKSYCW